MKIDRSRPAPNFRPVAFPNDWKKARKGSSAQGAISPRQELYREFFQVLIDELRERHKFTGARKAQPRSFYSFSSGFAGFTYGAAFTQGRKAQVELYIDGGGTGDNKSMFDSLAEHKQTIEVDLSEKLNWERLDNRRASRISVSRGGSISIDDDAENLEELRDWMIGQLLKFKEVFAPKLTKLGR